MNYLPLFLFAIVLQENNAFPRGRAPQGEGDGDSGLKGKISSTISCCS